MASFRQRQIIAVLLAWSVLVASAARNDQGSTDPAKTASKRKTPHYYSEGKEYDSDFIADTVLPYPKVSTCPSPCAPITVNCPNFTCPGCDTCPAKCPDDTVFCYGQCLFTPLKTVLACGECGRQCKPGATCVPDELGKYDCKDPDQCPQCSDPNTTPCFNGECVFLGTNANCLDCGNACPWPKICDPVDGCKCPKGTCTVDSNVICVDFETDPLYCGNCTNPCNPGDACVGGTCVTNKCPTPQVPCPPSGECTTLGTNANCAECGNACTGGSFCQSGQCVCRDNKEYCNGECVNTKTDNDNCGSCGNQCTGLNTCGITRFASGTIGCCLAAGVDCTRGGSCCKNLNCPNNGPDRVCK